ncbi:hypothetical protein PGTUg99_019400 [Puccinia graminis f. sp. tritici]|uniref:Uncharacterized protein n=1 Tax=Puccinia graminis f. sp. tritici TaxID=56615 RepID=A0A5B0P144_PUCGR|nr:hypothetical protein PGTUg99_019400 [Puccinia graminis f. sp. tritici]
MLNPERRPSPTSAITTDGTLSLGYRVAYQQVSKSGISESHQIVGVSVDLTEAHDDLPTASCSLGTRCRKRRPALGCRETEEPLKSFKSPAGRSSSYNFFCPPTFRHKIAHSSFRELVLLQILSVNSINHVANLESNDF